jgi:hypothetical protein
VEFLDIVTGLDPKELDTFFAQTPDDFDIATKVRKLLAALARKSLKPGDDVKIHPDTDFPLAYARDANELRYYVNYAGEIGWLTSTSNAHGLTVRLTPKGWEEAQHPARVDSNTAFVAMWFDESLTEAYTKGIQLAIEECGFRAVRVDLEDTNNDDIVYEILAKIRASRFVVADVTGHRQGVYFEAGFAKGLSIPVIWTCKTDDFRKEHRTFDTEHFNHVVWNDANDLRQKLVNRINGSIDIGKVRQIE